MKQNRFNEMSYNKAKQNRQIQRRDIFDKNRKTSTLSYLTYYPQDVREIILKSADGPIPISLPPPEQAVRSTISYYRRQDLPVFKTRQQGCEELDPHMVYESLWSLSKIADIKMYPVQVIKQFEADLHLYLKMPYQQIREIAVIAAGNKILGNAEDILQMMGLDQKNVWVMINHIYERRVDFKYMFQYVQKNVVIIYRAIYELTNNYKEDIIYPLVSNQEILNRIIQNFQSANTEIQDFSIRIIGNILAQIQDYAGDLTKYKLLDHIYPLLSSSRWQIRRDGCWLLANYAFGSGGAVEILYNNKLMQRFMILYKNETKIEVRNEFYYILSHLGIYGKKQVFYRWCLQQNVLDVCGFDLEIEDQGLILLTLSFVDKLVEIGDEFLDVDVEGGDVNVFSNYICSTNLKSIINTKTFSQDQNISSLSISILDKISTDGTEFDMNI